jgi:hypothetical protein
MYRDLLNGTLENYEGIDFKELLTNEILSDPRNKKLWRNFSSNRGGYVNMKPEILFKNIEDLLDEWELFGYWFFIGKGECPTHNTYIQEMNYLKDRSTELSNERHEGYDMGMQDVNVRPRSKSASRPKSKSKSKSNSNSNSNSKSKSKTKKRSQSQAQTQSVRQSARQSARLNSQSQKP